jgi:hypothetical protein
LVFGSKSGVIAAPNIAVLMGKSFANIERRY